jgi:ubiquinone/menaquinone biosynthesis C-methylase UbiE
MTSSTPPRQAEYGHGHHKTVLKSHTWRTVDNSAAYLVPYIKPSDKILDVGCGPGTITVDLAKLVPTGSVIGIDAVESVLAKARESAMSQSQSNVKFAMGNVFDLDYPDGTFDIVHAHQVLQHVHDPTAAMKEMRRVVKTGGIIAVRDMTHFLYYPETPEMDKFNEVFFANGKAMGAVPGAGKMLQRFAREAGFEKEKIAVTGSTWCYTAYSDLDFWCGEYVPESVNAPGRC